MYNIAQVSNIPVLRVVSSNTANEQARLSTGIIGTGNTARALAVYLSKQGHRVHFLARSQEKLSFLDKGLELNSEGKIDGKYAMASASCIASDFAQVSKVIFVATITTAYDEIAQRLAPYLNEQHKVILFSSKLGGTLLFEQSLRNCGAKVPLIMETDALFAARIKEDDKTIWIRGFKEWTLFSSSTRTSTMENADFLKQFFPKLSPAVNIIQRGLTDFGAVAHAPIALANMNLISRKTPFKFYYEGMTEETIAFLQAVEDEFRNIAAAYGSDLIPMKDLLNQYYGCDNSTLYSAMTTVPNYRHSLGPESLQHRFLHEDICSTLVPARQLAQLAGVKTPTLDAIVNLSSVLTKKNLESEGRSLAGLGFGGKNYKQIFDYVNS